MHLQSRALWWQQGHSHCRMVNTTDREQLSYGCCGTHSHRHTKLGSPYVPTGGELMALEAHKKKEVSSPR